ncbi:sensor histidine kinase [Sinomicrobium weinanense]|uniref:histidine kinase n=1 Tax=Sinomicrobium weinanense TaxID=2842200 RepID=A0A926Q1G3_9FLAO|nr:HAMP domain-containing sensor histidine kinase [Sinomicrobium weinanense]MBC9794769.1 HAMP domain-containing histidine kinase [Sinomicrobium weinanense]MBU3125028.1 HAMP domain-containing histidine kinase [Sinomicrobium weinanense]
MTSDSYKKILLLRVGILLISLTALAFAVSAGNIYAIVPTLLLSAWACYYLHAFCIKRFREIDDFFEAVKYRDFSRWYTENRGPEDMRQLHRGFNEVNRTVREMNSEKETQYLYLQKILEMVDVGIMAYNLNTGDVLWANESLRKNLDIPSVKNIRFIANRKPKLFRELLQADHSRETSVTVDVDNQKNKMLVSNAVFHVGKEAFKLLVLQNIEDTLNQNESEAWKKLLSVMTHEIMNSIAPISSLADTLKSNVQMAMEEPDQYPLEIEDLHTGIESIKKRSEGLMKFAKTYRSLNKVTSLNLSRIAVGELFRNINQLMNPSLQTKNIEVEYKVEPQDLEVHIDTYLIEQVLINLILNAVDACEGKKSPGIVISADRHLDGNTVIKVSDNGKGIPEEVIDNVFVPFFSTKKKGSGIGLSLCKQIMLLHKGRIQIRSVEGEGTVTSLIF